MSTTTPFRSILFPTDFSKSSEAITDHAVGLSKAAGVKVWILNVVPRLEEWHGVSETYFGPFSDSAIVDFEKHRTDLEAERFKMLEQFQAKHFMFGGERSRRQIGWRSGRDYRFCARKERRADHDADSSFRATTPISDRLNDRKSSTRCSMRRMDESSSTRTESLSSVSPDRSRNGLSFLIRSVAGTRFRVRRAFRRSLSVFSAIPTASEAGHQLVQKVKKDLTSALESQLAESKVKASIRLLEGNPGDVICEVAEDIEKADLLITGRGRLDEAAGHVHSHNYEIIWNAPCPVITI